MRTEQDVGEGPKIRRFGWPSVHRLKELSSRLYDPSDRLQSTWLP